MGIATNDLLLGFTHQHTPLYDSVGNMAFVLYVMVGIAAIGAALAELSGWQPYIALAATLMFSGMLAQIISEFYNPTIQSVAFGLFLAGVSTIYLTRVLEIFTQWGRPRHAVL